MSRPWFRVASTAVLVMMVSACSSDTDLSPPATGPSTSTTEAEPLEGIGYTGYVEDVIGILELEYWRTSDVDWDTLREDVLADLPDHPTQGQAYLAIDSAIALLDDPHTSFLRPSERAETGESGPVPYGERMDGDIGYLNLPGNGQLSEEAFVLYASDAISAMREVDQAVPTCGWVIDLRDNDGGSIPQMLLGLGPLFGDGVFLSYVGPTETVGWAFDGELRVNGSPYSELEYEGVIPTQYESKYVAPAPEGDVFKESMTLGQPYVPHDPDAPVVALIGPSTASAGEGVLVGFIGRPNTISMGTPTMGVPTGVLAVSFVDDATLAVAGARAQDRNGNLYSGAIQPDERVHDLFPLDETDDILNTAHTSLTEQCSQDL